ncbi:MAG: Hsp33 family molecular chaperone HslO [Kangiella sp.]|nr:MAG: Hsp33 family molecular chaperone HslO [Kangiella sp.]
MSDKIHRFIFDSFGIRGELVQLEDSVQRMLKEHNYPPIIADLLQQVAAAAILMTTTLKFEGRLSIQLQTNSALKLLVVQCNHKLGFRGIARLDKEKSLDDATFKEIAENGKLSITIEPKKGKRYQGLVALEKDNFAQCIEEYFNQSEQLRTRIWLFNNDSRVTGLMLQALPDMLSQDSFDHLVYLAQTLTEQECLTMDASILLHRLFHEEKVRNLLVEDVKFNCGCSRKKMLNSISLFPEEEIEEIIESKGHVAVKCEFCLAQFKFKRVDIKKHQSMVSNQTLH